MGDVWFEQRAGVLPGRVHDPVPGLPERAGGVGYAFVLHELGGTVTYYDESGQLVARVSALDERTDWMWHAGVPGRLVGVVDPDGVVTGLDWEDPGVVLVTLGANLPGEVDPATGERGAVPVWRVERGGGRVGAAVDPVGGRYSVRYDSSGLVSGVSGPSGGGTQIGWQGFGDGIARVSRVRTVDADGFEVSVREWAPGGDGVPSSGWPAFAGEGERFRSGNRDRYETVLSDGATQVVSEYDSQHRLLARRMVVTSGAGEWVLQEQAFTYPGTDGDEVSDPAALPGNWSRPTATQVTHRDAAGQTRTVSESTVYDESGRQVSATGADDTVTTTEYDPVIPEGAVLPVGLPVVQTVTAPDGLVEQIRRELNEARTGVVVSETWRGRVGEDLTRVGRAEFDLADDGMVTAQRAYPAGDPAATPTTTAWDRVVDLGAGTMTSTTTVAVGTKVEATTVEVTSLRHGGVLASTDPVGNTTRAGFDELGRARTAIDPSGNTSTQEYETAQHDGRNATVTTGADGVAVTEARDVLGRVTQTLDNIDHGDAVPGFTRVIETRDYPEPGTVVVTDAWGAPTTTRQDIFGRELETVGPTGLTKRTVHDDISNQTTAGLTPTGDIADAEQIVTQSRDKSGRVTSASGTRLDGVPVPEVTSTYDGFGRPTQTADGTLETAVGLDEFGNPVTTTFTPITASKLPEAAFANSGASAVGAEHRVTASRRFDGFGASLEKTLTGADGESRSGGARTVDPLGRTSSETDQVGRVTTISYTVDGLVDEVVGAAGQVTEHEYDAVTRALLESTVTSPVGETVRTGYEYDPVTGGLVGVFDPADRARTEIRYQRDAHGHATVVTYPDGKRIEHRYDAHGRRTHTTDIAGNVTTLTHTREGLVVRAIQHDATGVLLGEVEYEHDEFGRLARLSRGNGVVTEYTFTSASEIASEITTNGVGTVLAKRTYTYDPRGNLLDRTDRTHDGPAAEPVTTATSYRYDSHDRLVGSVTRTAGKIEREVAYELTASGDIRTETVTVTAPDTGTHTATVRGFEYSPLGELAAETVTVSTSDQPGTEIVTRTESVYDEAGNLLRALDGTETAYDAANRPVRQAAPDGEVAETGYWPDGTRRHTTHTLPGRTPEVTGYYWDDTTLINETHIADPPGETGVVAYLTGASRHARSATATDVATTGGEGGSSTTWYGTDRHGNITELTDGTGSVITRYTYTDYGLQSVTRPAGEPDPGSGLVRNPFGYAGEYTDLDGTQYLRSRIYDPHTMRFTTMDTAELHNLYAYADLNPITRIDPTGRAGQVDWQSIVNGVMIGISLLSFYTAVGSMFSIVRTVLTALRFSESAYVWWMAKEAAQTAGLAITKLDLFALGVSALDLGSAISGAVVLGHKHVRAVTDDPDIVAGLEWAEAVGGIGAIGAGYLGAKSARMSKRLEHLQAWNYTLGRNPLPTRPADSLLGGLPPTSGFGWTKPGSGANAGHSSGVELSSETLARRDKLKQQPIAELCKEYVTTCERVAGLAAPGSVLQANAGVLKSLSVKGEHLLINRDWGGIRTNFEEMGKKLKKLDPKSALTDVPAEHRTQVENDIQHLNDLHAALADLGLVLKL